MGTHGRFYLNRTNEHDGHALSRQSEPKNAITQRIGLKDCSDLNQFALSGSLIDQVLDDWPIVTRGLDLANTVTTSSADNIVFETEPLVKDTEISASFLRALTSQLTNVTWTWR